MERYTDTKRTVWYIVMAMSLMLLALLGMQYREKTRLQQGIAEKVLRFHVRANSDSEEDQRLKLAVRDAVGEELAVGFPGLIPERDVRSSPERRWTRSRRRQSGWSRRRGTTTGGGVYRRCGFPGQDIWQLYLSSGKLPRARGRHRRGRGAKLVVCDVP